jgi:hypothetical protein
MVFERHRTIILRGNNSVWKFAKEQSLVINQEVFSVEKGNRLTDPHLQRVYVVDSVTDKHIIIRELSASPGYRGPLRPEYSSARNVGMLQENLEVRQELALRNFNTGRFERKNKLG